MPFVVLVVGLLSREPVALGGMEPLLFCNPVGRLPVAFGDAGVQRAFELPLKSGNARIRCGACASQGDEPFEETGKAVFFEPEA